MITETAKRIGLSDNEAVVCMIIDDLWSVIDWSDGLWKNRVACYDRLENCLRVASSEVTLREFSVRLAMRMHVSAMDLSVETLTAINAININEQSQLLTSVRRESGLYMAALRIYRDERKQEYAKRTSKTTTDNAESTVPLWR